MIDDAISRINTALAVFHDRVRTPVPTEDLRALLAHVAALASAQKRIEALTEALKPFVEWSKHDLATADELQPDMYAYDDGSEADVREFDGNGTHPLLWGDFRRAARLLKDTQG